jgi:uncharacterized membrane protein YcaP (DUF421 family)
VDPLRIALRALFAFVFLLAVLRISGKRFVAQATGFDFVLALILSDLIDDVLWAEVTAAQFVTAGSVLVLCEIVIASASARSQRLATLFEGVPRMVLRDGSPLTPPMRHERINENELEELLRTEGLPRPRWGEVKSAWIENSGDIGLLKHDWARAVQKTDLPRVRKGRR